MDQTASLLRDDDLAHASPSHSLDLSDNDDNDPYPHAYDQEKPNSTAAHRIIQQRQYRAIAISLLTLLTCFTIGSIISTLSMNVSGPAESPTSTSMGECGRTPEQCAKNGCIFDLMMSGWVHPPCYDEELSNQFLRENNFAFFHDGAGTQPLSEAEARLGLYRTIYTNGTFHHQHCTYLWAKQLRARLKKPYVLDSDSRSVEHVQHCLHRAGAPNATQVVLQTGTTLHAGSWQLDCIIGEREVHTGH